MRKAAGGQSLPEGGDQAGDLRQLEEAAWQFAAGRDASAEGTVRREQRPEKDRRRPDFGSGNAAGGHPAKALKPGRMRKLGRAMRVEWCASIRRTCGALRFDTSKFHYKSRRTDQAAIERRIREICETRVRYRYRRVHILLRREGWQIVLPAPRICRGYFTNRFVCL